MNTVTILSRFRRSAFVFPLAVLAALALMVISETAYRQSNEALERLGTIGQSRTAIQDLLRRVTQAEASQRGYLLTGRKEYLEPYRTALPEVEKSLQFIRRYYAPDVRHTELSKRLDSLTRTKMSELATTLSQYDEGREESWRALMTTDIGREQMDALRQLCEQLIAIENEKVATGRKDVTDTLWLNRIGVAAMAAISLLALAMYLRQTNALDDQRHAQALAVQAERDLLEHEVKRRTAELTELTQHLQTAREDERSRLARELHDELGALLTAAKLDAARIKSRLGHLVPDAHERLAHLNETLNSGIALKRRIIEDLRPSSLSNLGLVAALEIQAREFSERSSLQVRTSFERVPMDANVELTVYRMVQEAFTNIAKYAQAKTVEVSLVDRADHAEISVKDDGVGFELNRTAPSAHGLRGMRYRVTAEGGELRIESSPGRGTLLSARLPKSSGRREAVAHSPAVDEVQ